MRINFIGDVHGQFEKLKHILEENPADLALVAGDYGIWTDFRKESIPERYHTDFPYPVWFIDGNHENHNELDKYERGKIHQLTDKLSFCAYGSTFTHNATTFLFCGGAYSIDKHLRVPFVSWWPTECITEEDQSFLPDCNVDVVVSHTAPSFIVQDLAQVYPGSNEKILAYDPSCDYLEDVYKWYKPKIWIFGHWHKYYKAVHDDCLFVGLDMVPLRTIRSSQFLFPLNT